MEKYHCSDAEPYDPWDQRAVDLQLVDRIIARIGGQQRGVVLRGQRCPQKVSVARRCETCGKGA
jgi:hypothetical protein